MRCGVTGRLRLVSALTSRAVLGSILHTRFPTIQQFPRAIADMQNGETQSAGRPLPYLDNENPEAQTPPALVAWDHRGRGNYSSQRIQNNGTLPRRFGRVREARSMCTWGNVNA